MKKLSIITINFNNRDGLQKTIDSVIHQTYKDFEWIIIDGGSTDGSKELIEQYNSYITYWVSEPDKGIYNAMNKGIRVANGEYLYFLNSGDLLYDQYTLAKVFTSQHAGDVLYGDLKRIKDYCVVDQITYPPILTLKTFIKGTICHQVAFFKKECFMDAFYDESYKFCADVKHFIYLMVKGFSFEHLNFYVASYDVTGCSAQDATLNTRIAEKRKIISELIPDTILKDYQELFELDNRLIHVAKQLLETNKCIKTIAEYTMRILLKCYRIAIK